MIRCRFYILISVNGASRELTIVACWDTLSSSDEFDIATLLRQISVVRSLAGAL